MLSAGASSTVGAKLGFQSVGYESKRHIFETIILLLLGGYLLVDTLNGFITQKLAGPNGISALYKQGLLLLCLMYNLVFSPGRLLACGLLLLCIFSWAFVRFFAIDGILFLYAFQESIKTIFYFILVITLSGFRSLAPKTTLKITLFCIFVLVLNVLATYAGFGEFTYDNFGAKGFFYAGNAISSVIVICASVLLCFIYQRSLTRFLGAAFLLLALAVIIGTKAGVMGVVLATALILTLHLNTKTLFVGLLAVSALVAFGFIFMDTIFEHALYQRIKYFYEMGGVQTVLFSGRDVFLERITPLFHSQAIPGLFLGLDAHTLGRIGLNRVELDWMDLVINFGLVLTLLVYTAHIAIFIKLLTSPKSIIVNAAIVTWLILMMVSSLSGHVVFNGMVTPLWALVTATALNENNESVG